MSGDLSPALVGEQAPATQISPEEIARIHGMLTQSVELAEEAMKRIRELTGPQPGHKAHEMLMGINRGTGFLRHHRDSIAFTFREWERCQTQAACPHDHGFTPGPREVYFCKRCGLQFARQADGTMRPSEIQL